MDELDSTLPLDDTDLDPVDVILHFAQRLESLRATRNPLQIDRDRLLVTIILALLSDPHHHVGKRITKPILQCYLERGGRLYRKGTLAKAMRDPDQFQHTVRYLRDYGMKIRQIAEALGVTIHTVERVLSEMRQQDRQDALQSSAPSDDSIES